MINLPVEKFDSLVAAMASELSRGCTRLHVDEDQKTTSDLISFICDDAELCDELFNVIEGIFKSHSSELMITLKEKAANQFCNAWARTAYQPIDEEGAAV